MAIDVIFLPLPSLSLSLLVDSFALAAASLCLKSWYLHREPSALQMLRIFMLDFFAACSNSTATVTRNDYIKKGTVNSLNMQYCNRQY